MDPIAWVISNVEKLSLLTVAGLIILSLFKGWIVTGREYGRAIIEGEFHKAAHQRIQERLEQSLDVNRIVGAVAQRVVDRKVTSRSRQGDERSVTLPTQGDEDEVV